MNTFKTLTHAYTYPIPCKNPAMPNFKWSNASTPFTYQFNEVKYCSLINFKCGSEDVWNGGWKWNDDNKNDNTSLPSKMVRHVSHSWVYSSILLRAKRAEIFWHLFYPETNIFGGQGHRLSRRSATRPAVHEWLSEMRPAGQASPARSPARLRTGRPVLSKGGAGAGSAPLWIRHWSLT